MYYVARKDNTPFFEVPEPEHRILSVLISPELDPTNHDVALGRTEMTPGCQSDVRGHEEGELFYCIRGKGTVEIEGVDYELSEGEAVYVPPFVVHTLKSDKGENFDLIWFLTPPFGGDRKTLGMIKDAEEKAAAK
ncbi:MAG: cupin domain-containing protein [Firmicutes bacterium]|nr:cupin domain-containing protein [Bacillota bacterium]MBQ4649718.1 cupin domain-containing protein [Bacillota bacterium]